MPKSAPKHLPQQVIEVERNLIREVAKGHQKAKLMLKLLKRLTSDRDGAYRMWNTIERKRRIRFSGFDTRSSPTWVYNFLFAVQRLTEEAPRFLDKSTKARRTLAKKFRIQAYSLADSLEALSLGGNIVYVRDVLNSDGKRVGGGFYAQDCEPLDEPDASNSLYVNSDHPRLSVAKFLRSIGDNAAKQLTSRQSVGKAGANVKAVYFVRQMVKHNQRSYGSPLNEVIAFVCNTIFGTEYAPSDVRRLAALEK